MFRCILHHLQGELNVFLIQNHLILKSRVHRIYRIGNKQYDCDSRVNNNNNNHVKRPTDVFEISVTTWTDFPLSCRQYKNESGERHSISA